jgi:hypothetical protein
MLFASDEEMEALVEIKSQTFNRHRIFVQVYASLRWKSSLVGLFLVVHNVGRTCASVRRADHPALVKLLGELWIELNAKVAAADASLVYRGTGRRVNILPTEETSMEQRFRRFPQRCNPRIALLACFCSEFVSLVGQDD